MKNSLLWIFFLFLLSCQGAKIHQLRPYDFPKPVDTHSRPVNFQDKKVYTSESSRVYASNKFAGARLNNFEQVNDSTFKVSISPENQPVNPSPWYAFKLWADTSCTIYLSLDYKTYKHRYPPKFSYDGLQWQYNDSLKIELNEDSTVAVLQVPVSSDTLWMAAQEIITTREVADWCQDKLGSPMVDFDTIGYSTLDRPMLMLDMGEGPPLNKEMIVVLSRQHPPEVTGFLAMQAFLETILNESPLSKEFLHRYRVLVFPLLNPDGVDLGHWRHNAGGVDLNRDWAFYRQPEIRQVAGYIVKEAERQKSKVVLGLDFHSTYQDVYYTNEADTASVMPHFTDRWLRAIGESIEGYHPDIQPSGLTMPVSKNWFYVQFKAVGITYEIGDDTPREFIQLKGKVSAKELMKIMMER